MADLCCNAEPLLICEVVKQELVDTHPFFLVIFSLQREETLRPVVEQDILQGLRDIMQTRRNSKTLASARNI